ncbi:predicted protein [Sclerotinia sclerotiorum 1980 UF-70]|uniref:Mid2 domain-containing protein n=1 Tax=Sclerotinia sclerotiorum (strain ATCC 18683 / 1980 / Ss-1) TaxID=665079 RepID=A7EFQ0_SCLS1|nr:predicted protein [Sclerotinia sclerotiorum 1980 UF-70]EDO01666.1 predicted protein [Sclerotinia sclerotiorum 1980 UF-70]
MTGNFSDEVVAANNKVDSMAAPYRTISCGAKSGRECDQKLLESLGLGAVTGDSASVSSTTAATATTDTTAATKTTDTTATTAITGSTAMNSNSAAGQVNTNTTSSKKTSGGMIAGVVVGAIAAVSITIAAAVFLLKRARKRRISKGEMVINDMSLTGQKPGAFYQKDTYGGVTKNYETYNISRRAEMDSDRTYEMGGDHHGFVEMPGSSICKGRVVVRR